MFVVTKVGFVHGRLAGALRFVKPLLWAVLLPQPATRGAVLQARAQTMSQNFSPHISARPSTARVVGSGSTASMH
jgi:hypothetical protein